jgi:hypothetical protein
MERRDIEALLAQVKEIEELLRFPSVSGHLARANHLALSIARSVPGGAVVSLAMQVISEANSLRPPVLPLRPDDHRLHELLQRLREALIALESAE